MIVKCCTTDEMVGDFMTKGPQGIKFAKFCKAIMGHQECRMKAHVWCSADFTDAGKRNAKGERKNRKNSDAN